MKRTSIGITGGLVERLQARAAELGMSSNSLATLCITGCLDAMDSPQPTTPDIVRRFRRSKYLDLGFAEKVVLPVLRAIFPQQESEDKAWQEELGRMIDAALLAHDSIEPATMQEFGREARKIVRMRAKALTTHQGKKKGDT